MAILLPLQNSFSVFSKTFYYLKKSKNMNENVELVKRNWAQEILKSVSIKVNVIGEVSDDSSMLFVGNHISYLDIPLLLAHVNKLSFVAKKELKSWPIFGAAAQRIDTVFVKRESKISRSAARESVQTAIREGKRIAIFPSGTTCVSESKIWRNGVFKIASDANCLVQPFRITYSDMRTAAYIDKDFFPAHLLKVCKSQELSATIEFHEPVKITDAVIDCQKWNAWSKGLINATSN